jgi:hypothetical protein
LLERFPDLRLAVPRDELHWSHGDGLVLRGLAELPVHLTPATPTRPGRAGRGTTTSRKRVTP